MSDTPAKTGWLEAFRSLSERHQQLLREYADDLRGPAAEAIWPNKENEMKDSFDD